MDFTRRRVPFCQEKRFLAIFVDGNVNHHHGMSVLAAIACGIDKHVAWLHVCQPPGLHLSTERKGTGYAIEVLQIAFERLARLAAAIT